MKRELTIDGSGTPIEKEYRTIARAIQRCTPADVTFDAKAYAPRAVERVRAMWLRRMESEYRSTTVFSALVAQLFDANATIDHAGVVLRMAQDELRHAEICGETVIALGGVAVGQAPPTVRPLAMHRGCSPEERAMRNVMYGTCLGEMVNCARFVDAIDTMHDPYLRDVTRRLLADEVLHGQFGFHYLEAWRPWLDANPEVRVSLERYLRHAFAVLERDLSGAGAAPEALTDDERALGVPDRARLPETFYATVTGAIVPGLERFGIEAGAAWKARSLVLS